MNWEKRKWIKMDIEKPNLNQNEAKWNEQRKTKLVQKVKNLQRPKMKKKNQNQLRNIEINQNEKKTDMNCETKK